MATVSGGGEINTANDTATDVTAVATPADLTIVKTHANNFTQGQIGAVYTITVINSGATVTNGAMTVVDTLPSGLTATAISGTGWTCSLGTLTCTTSVFLVPRASSAPITLTVNVATNAPATLTNTAMVSGGGEINTANDTAMDPTTVNPPSPDMSIAMSHTGSFMQGQAGAIYTITATNSGTLATNAAVNVVDMLPAGLSAAGMAGSGWTCTVLTVTCVRADPLAAAASYPPITLTVNVAGNAAASVTNIATVSGGGELITANDVASDPTTIVPVPVASLSTNSLVFSNQPILTNSAQQIITLTNNGGATLFISATPLISGTNAAEFTFGQLTSCINGLPVSVGGTCTVSIIFTPGATGARGPATLTLTDTASPTTQSVALSGTGVDYTESGPTSPVTVAAGQTANFMISLAPVAGGFANPITFSASGLPTGASATFNPTTVTPGSAATSTTLSISTTARSGLAPYSRPWHWAPSKLFLWTWPSVAILSGLLMFIRKRHQSRFASAIFVMTLLWAVIAMTGCGGGSSGGGSINPGNPDGTPAGTSIITVTATSGSVVHTTTVTLTVQ